MLSVGRRGLLSRLGVKSSQLSLNGFVSHRCVSVLNGCFIVNWDEMKCWLTNYFILVLGFIGNGHGLQAFQSHSQFTFTKGTSWSNTFCSNGNTNNNNNDVDKDEISVWLETNGLQQYRSVIEAMQFDTLLDIGGVTGEKFCELLEKELQKKEFKAGHLGKFGNAVDKLRAASQEAPKGMFV